MPRIFFHQGQIQYLDEGGEGQKYFHLEGEAEYLNITKERLVLVSAPYTPQGAETYYIEFHAPQFQTI